MEDPRGIIAGVGYAGSPKGKNNPALQHVPDVGPLPQGRYVIGAPDPNHPRLGPLAFPLTPDPQNEMFNRSGFFIHADSFSHPGAASEGCIVLPHNIRELIAASTDRALEVMG